MHKRLFVKASISGLSFAGLWAAFVLPALSQDVFGGGAAVAPAKKAPSVKVSPVKAAPAKSMALQSATPATKSRPASGSVGRGPTHSGVPRSERIPAPPLASPGAVRAYCGKLWNKIQNNWEFPSGKNHVVLGVDVDGGGNVFSTRATSTPKNADAEARAQAALTKSQPLDALPAGLPSAHLTITFDSTADPHGDANSNGSVRLEYHPGSNPNMDNGGGAQPSESENTENNKPASSKAESEKGGTASSGAASAPNNTAQPGGAGQSPTGNSQNPAH